MASLMKSHPGKAIYTLATILFAAVRFPLWMIYFLPSFTRQSSKWTFRKSFPRYTSFWLEKAILYISTVAHTFPGQAIGVRVLRIALGNMSAVEMKTPEDLKPGKEGDRFVTIQPSKKSNYIGNVSKDKEIQPVKIGGTWYPERPSPGAISDVIMHFHGGKRSRTLFYLSP